MSILQIGRAFDAFDVDVSSARWSGDQLSLAGDLYLGSVAAASRVGTAAGVRDRLLALQAGNDERTVPVVWSEDPSIDGWYRVTASTVDYSPASLNDGYMAWSADLAFVSGTPQVEIVGSFGLIDNDESITTATFSTGSIIGVPGSATDLKGIAASTSYVPISRASSDGTCQVFYDLGYAASTATYTVDPSDHYEAACSIRGTYAGIADTLVLGRDMEPLGGSNLVLSNNIVRCGFSAGGAIQVECWDTSAWRTVGASTWGLTGLIVFAGGTWTFNCTTSSGVQILRNSPECVSVRLFNVSSGAYLGRFWVDITIKRGSRLVEFHSQNDTYMNLNVTPSSAIASTGSPTFTGGLRKATNDAYGNRSIVVGARGRNVTSGATGPSYAWAENLVTGAISQVNVTGLDGYYDAPFAIGVELDGTSATSPNTAQAVAMEFFNGRNETQRVVQR